MIFRWKLGWSYFAQHTFIQNRETTWMDVCMYVNKSMWGWIEGRGGGGE